MCEVKGCPRLDAGRASLPQTSSWTSARRSRLFLSHYLGVRGVRRSYRLRSRHGRRTAGDLPTWERGSRLGEMERRYANARGC